MDVRDALLVAVRWAHALAAAAWVGGGIFYLMVLRPAMDAVEDGSAGRGLSREVAAGFKEVVDLCIITLVATGAIITFERLSHQGVDNTYLAVLGLKLAASAALILLSRSMGQAGNPRPGDATPAERPSSSRLLTAPRIALALGVAIFFLAGLLGILYENGLSAF